MILVRNWRPKQGHNAIAHDLVHCPFVVMHRRHHVLQHRVEKLARLLGVAVGEQCHGALQTRLSKLEGRMDQLTSEEIAALLGPEQRAFMDTLPTAELEALAKGDPIVQRRVGRAFQQSRNGRHPALAQCTPHTGVHPL